MKERKVIERKDLKRDIKKGKWGNNKATKEVIELEKERKKKEELIINNKKENVWEEENKKECKGNNKNKK